MNIAVDLPNQSTNMEISNECIRSVVEEPSIKVALHADDMYQQTDDIQVQKHRCQHQAYDTQQQAYSTQEQTFDIHKERDSIQADDMQFQHVTDDIQHVAYDSTLHSTQCNKFLTGYMDCAEEALWYLTEVEKLPPDHPMVMGLKMSLYEQYRILNLQYILQNSLNTCNETTLEQTNLTFESNDTLGDRNVIENDANDGVAKCAIQTESNAVDSMERSLTVGTENVPNSVTETAKDAKEHNTTTPEETGLSPEAHKMAVTLAEEIYALLNGTDDSDITDDEEESIDEGFEEMIEL